MKEHSPLTREDFDDAKRALANALMALGCNGVDVSGPWAQIGGAEIYGRARHSRLSGEYECRYVVRRNAGREELMGLTSEAANRFAEHLLCAVLPPRKVAP